MVATTSHIFSGPPLPKADWHSTIYTAYGDITLTQ